MKYVKALALAAATAAVAMALAGTGSASATVMCETKTDPCTAPYETSTSWAATLAEGKTVFETTGGTILDECSGSTTEGMVENAGGASLTVSLSAGFGFTLCGLVTVEVKVGTLELHQIKESWNFTVTGKGAEFTLGLIFGTCTFSQGSGTHLGTLTLGWEPEFHAKGKLVKSAGGALCPTEVIMRGEYVVTTPTPIYAAAS